MNYKSIAFYVSDKRHLDYYNNVLNQLERQGVEFILILNDTLGVKYGFENYPVSYVDEMIQSAQQENRNFLLLTEAVEKQNKFKILISTYTYKYPVEIEEKNFLKKSKVLLLRLIRKLTGFKKIKINKGITGYPEELLGDFKISFPKGLDINESKFPNSFIEEHADLYFCHGNYDKRLVDRHSEKEGFIIGYPRYDSIVTCKEVPNKNLIQEFNLDPEKKIIVWLPSYFPGENQFIHIIEEWNVLLKPIMNEYEIILRPHPKSLERESSVSVTKLIDMGYKIDTVTERDMSELYGTSDFVFCDYGGSVFSAVYTDCKMLLLNHAFHKEYAKNNEDHLHIKVRDVLLNVSSEELRKRGGFTELLNDDNLWHSENVKRRKIRDEYFGGVVAGEGSIIAAKKIKKFIHGSEE